MAEIGEAGGTANIVAVSPTLYATTAAVVGSDGHPVYPAGIASLLGLTPVQVPGLTTPIVYDSAEVRLLVAREFEVIASTDYGPAFQHDSVALKVSGRFNVAIPTPTKAIRKLTITP